MVVGVRLVERVAVRGWWEIGGGNTYFAFELDFLFILGCVYI